MDDDGEVTVCGSLNEHLGVAGLAGRLIEQQTITLVSTWIGAPSVIVKGLRERLGRQVILAALLRACSRSMGWPTFSAPRRSRAVQCATGVSMSFSPRASNTTVSAG